MLTDEETKAWVKEWIEFLMKIENPISSEWLAQAVSQLPMNDNHAKQVEQTARCYRQWSRVEQSYREWTGENLPSTLLSLF